MSVAEPEAIARPQPRQPFMAFAQLMGQSSDVLNNGADQGQRIIGLGYSEKSLAGLGGGHFYTSS
jgi:hypothetical protein